MSKFIYLAPGVDITLSSRIFTVRRETVGILQSPGCCTLSPPTVSLVMLGSLFSCLLLTTTLPYMTSRQRASGVSSLLMNIMVFVPRTRPGIPCDSHPNLFPYDVPHTLQYLGLFMRCRISISALVSPYKTALSICIGDFLLASFSGVTFSFSVLTYVSIDF